MGKKKTAKPKKKSPNVSKIVNTSKTNKRQPTLRQAKFIDAYLVSGNATKAAIAAGYSHKGAGVRGACLLKVPCVKEQLDARRKKIVEEFDVTIEDVVKQLKGLAVTAVPDASRIRALELLGKYLGMFVDKHDVSMTGPRVKIIIPDNGRGGQNAVPDDEEE